jgi:hypothetical protein
MEAGDREHDYLTWAADEFPARERTCHRRPNPVTADEVPNHLVHDARSSRPGAANSSWPLSTTF